MAFFILPFFLSFFIYSADRDAKGAEVVIAFYVIIPIKEGPRTVFVRRGLFGRLCGSRVLVSGLFGRGGNSSPCPRRGFVKGRTAEGLELWRVACRSRGQLYACPFNDRGRRGQGGRTHNCRRRDSRRTPTGGWGHEGDIMTLLLLTSTWKVHGNRGRDLGRSSLWTAC